MIEFGIIDAPILDDEIVSNDNDDIQSILNEAEIELVFTVEISPRIPEGE